MQNIIPPIPASLAALARTVRAIGVCYARRMLRPIILVGAVVLVVLLAAGGWLVTQNAWWWLFEALLILVSLVGIALVVGVLWILRRVEPPMEHRQRQAVAAFVDKLERVAEHLQTPQFMIVYYVLRDIVRPSADSFIKQVSHDSKTLAADFEKLRSMFA